MSRSIFTFFPFFSVSERPLKEKQARVCPGERATSKISSSWLQFGAPVASNANPLTCQRCCLTMIPVWHHWQSCSSWMTTQMPTYTERIQRLQRICQTSESFNLVQCYVECTLMYLSNFTNLNIYINKCFIIIWYWYYSNCMDVQH